MHHEYLQQGFNKDAVARFARRQFQACGSRFATAATEYVTRSMPADGKPSDTRNLLTAYHADLCRQFFLSIEIQNLMNKMTQRRFSKDEIQVDAGNYVIDQIAENQFQRLRKYSGSISKEGYLRSLIRNLLEDFDRRLYGRQRPPAWLSRLGSYWEKIYRLICLERRADEEVIKLLSEPGRGPAVDSGEVKHAIREIRSRIPECGQYRTLESIEMAESWENGMHGETHTDNQDDNDSLENQQPQTIMANLQALILGEKLATNSDNDSVLADLKALQLSADDTLILRLICNENHKVASVARLLGQSDHSVRRRYKQILLEIQSILLKHNYGFEEFESLVDSV